MGHQELGIWMAEQWKLLGTMGLKRSMTGQKADLPFCLQKQILEEHLVMQLLLPFFTKIFP